jgi:prepilin-type N-terminal cleavage/methylation domain-containing protein
MHNRGFSLLEILLVVGIMGVLAAVIAFPLSSFHRAQKIRGATADVSSLVQQAQSLTLASHDSLQYGVHLTTTTATLFSGTTYIANAASNRVTTLPSGVTATWSLQGSGADIIFERLTGETNQYGTITLSLSSPTLSRIITVSKLGSVATN